VATAVDDGTVIFGETRRPFDLLLGVPPHRVTTVIAASGLTGGGPFALGIDAVDGRDYGWSFWKHLLVNNGVERRFAPSSAVGRSRCRPGVAGA
jgi:hypothetical protein